jgi:LysM repeat protein
MKINDILHFANVKRMAAGILLVGGALILTPRAAFAQEAILVPIPFDGVAPDIAPAPRAAVSSEIVSNEMAASTSSDLTHVIAVGDTLSNIAQRYDVELANLAAYNQILDHNHVMIGQKLHIPPAGVTITAPAVVTVPGADGYYVMRQGDALGAVARKYGLTLEELLALNEIENPNLVHMGTMLRLTADVESPTTPLAPEVNVVSHTVQQGETLSEIAHAYATSTGQILKDNNLTDPSVREGQVLQIFPPASALEAFGVDAPVDGERHIVIDLSDQTLTAYQGEVQVLFTYVSTGKAATPTRPGDFVTYQKLDSQHMTGEDYDLPGVPWVMYYDGENAIHGAYWHANFGTPTSHGCTNMSIPESKALYSWAPLGTRVTVEW